HLDEVAGPVGPAVQITLLAGAAARDAARGARNVADSGREPRENRIEMPHDGLLAADHHAIAALEAPYAAARSDVDVMDALARELLCAANVVDVIRIAAVDHDVAGREMRHQRRECLVDDGGGNHQPDRPRRRELPGEVGE